MRQPNRRSICLLNLLEELTWYLFALSIQVNYNTTEEATPTQSSDTDLWMLSDRKTPAIQVQTN